jgi:hypothetical protein
MEHIQTDDSDFNQYWFYVNVSKEFNIYPDSNGCNLGTPIKKNKRMVGLTTPKTIDKNTKYKYIVSTDFNIDGVTSDWWCGGKGMIKGWGGIINRDCVDDPKYLMKNFMETLRRLVKKGYIIIHLSMTSEDVYINQPCESTNICEKCWIKNNPDKLYLESLFDEIYNNNFPYPLKNVLNIDYNMLTLLGYSVGTGAVSRYFNEFPVMKTISGKPLPHINTGVMIAGGSLYCFSKDCKDVYCNGDTHFSPCYNPNLKTRGCCPHDLTEPNYDNGIIPWSEHPPVLIIQSIDDSYSDPMAGTYYYNILRKHDVPAEKVMAESTVHGIATEHQVTSIIEWIEKYNNSVNSVASSTQSPPTQPSNPIHTVSVVILVIVYIVVILLLLLVFTGIVKSTLKKRLLSLFVGILIVALATFILFHNVKQNTSPNSILKTEESGILKNAIDTINNAPRVTAGELFDKIVVIKDNIYSQQPNLGGILVHMLPLEDLEAINNQSDFIFNLGMGNLPESIRDGLIADCSIAGQNKQNCSAWTYLRKDLPPIVYSYPSSASGPKGMQFWSPSVGIIVDPSRIWPLITTMGLVDSSTDGRNCGSQDPSYQANIFDEQNSLGRCNITVSDDNSNSKNYCVYQSVKTSVGCNSQCDYDNNIESTNCRMRNAGGSINNNSWYINEKGIYGWDCPETSGWKIANYPNGMPDCYKAYSIEWGNIEPEDKKFLTTAGYGEGGKCKKWAQLTPNSKCYMTNPTIYKIASTVAGGQVGNMIDGTNMEVPSLLPGTDTTNAGRNYMYVGEQVNQNVGGSTFSEQTWKNCTVSPEPTKCLINDTSSSPQNIPISTYNTITKQAKWIKQDWGRWVEELQKFWSYIYSTLSSETGYKNITATLDGNGVACDNGKCNYNWVYGNPCNQGDWWENEVNIYVNDEMAMDETSDVNVLFRESMLGVFYIGKTCEDFASELPTGTTVTGEGKCSFKNSEERCAGYLCSADINKENIGATTCNDGKSTYSQIKQEELSRMARGKEAVVTFSEKFNKLYRAADNPITGYKLITSSNAFPTWKSLHNTFSGMQTSDDVIIPIK